jgi:hypothetical protein
MEWFDGSEYCIYFDLFRISFSHDSRISIFLWWARTTKKYFEHNDDGHLYNGTSIIDLDSDWLLAII